MSRSSDFRGFRRTSDTARRTALAFQRGEPAAVERVRRYVGRILAYRGLGIPRVDLLDLEQQVMTEVWGASMRQGFDPAAGLWGFVETVTARRCIDARRRARPTTELSDSLRDGGADPLERVLVGERVEMAREILAQLAVPCRALIRLHAVQHLTYQQIAPILGKSEGALRVQMHRCVENARRLAKRSAHPATPLAKTDGGEK